MDDKFRPIDASLDEDATQTIELTEVFTRDLTATGSFDVRGDIWKTTFGKVIQGLPIPALLIDQSFRIVVTNEAWGKIGLKQEEMKSSLLSRLFPGASTARKVQSLLEEVFSTRKPVVARGTLGMGDSRIWARMSFRSIRIMEERFILLLVEDLTAEKQIVEQNKKHREELEKRVEERTSELMAANAQLKEEVAERKRMEMALRASEERYRILAENSLTGIFVHQDGKLVYINRRAAEGMGYSENELIGKSVWELLAPEDREMAKSLVAARLQGKQVPFQYQFRVLTRNGETRWAESRATEIEHNGRPATLGCIMDITDRKNAEDALRESEERYRALYEDNPSMYFTMDAQGTVLSVNRFGASELGYSVEELVGQPVLMVFHEDDREAVRQQFAAWLQNPMQVAHWEFRKVRKDGSILWVKEVARSIRGADGNPVVLVVCEDITEAKKAEEALRESEEFNRRMVYHAPLGIIYLTVDGVIAFTNPGSNRIFGVPEDKPSPLVGINIFELPVISDQPHVAARFRELVDEGRPQSDIELAYRSPLTGKDYVLLASATPRISIDGSIVGSVVMLADITDRKKAEEALRRAHDELEDRVRERTSELRKANEQLKLEIAEREEAEDALRLSEDKYRLLVDKAPIGIVSVDKEGRILEINQKLLEMLGSPSADATKAINVLSFELLVASGISGVFSNCLEQGTDQSAEVPYTSKWGKTVYLRSLMTPLFDESGDVIGCQAVMEDISERKKVEQALRESEERLELALRGADLAIWDYNLQTGEATFNARRAEMVGYSMEEAEPRFSWWGKQVHPEDVDRVIEAFNAHAEGRSPSYECEHRLRHKSGEYIWILARAKIVERDERGNPVRMVGTSLDITDRKRAEEALLSARDELQHRVEERTAELRRSEEKYRTLFEESIDAVYMTTREGILVDANQAFLDLFGFGGEEARNMDILRIYTDAADRKRMPGGNRTKGVSKRL